MSGGWWKQSQVLVFLMWNNGIVHRKAVWGIHLQVSKTHKDAPSPTPLTSFSPFSALNQLSVMAVRIPSRSCRFWAYKLKFSCLPELPTQNMHLIGSLLCFKAFSSFSSSQNRGMSCSAAFQDLVIWFHIISSTPLSLAPLHEALVQNQIWTGTFPLLFFSRLPRVPSFILVPPMLDWGYTKVRAQFQHLLCQMSFPLGVLSVLLCMWSTFLGTSITEVTMECLSLQLCIDFFPSSICCCCC